MAKLVLHADGTDTCWCSTCEERISPADHDGVAAGVECPQCLAKTKPDVQEMRASGMTFSQEGNHPVGRRKNRPMGDRSISGDPSVIGYWARVHDLSWEQLYEEGGQIRDALDAAGEALRMGDQDVHSTFMEGWHEADLELQGERHAAMLDSLADAYASDADKQKEALRRVKGK